MSWAHEMAALFGTDAERRMGSALRVTEGVFEMWLQAAYQSARLAGHFGRIALAEQDPDSAYSWKCLLCGRETDMPHVGCPKCVDIYRSLVEAMPPRRS